MDNSIFHRRFRLDRERSAHQSELMKEYDIEYHRKRKELQQECADTVGHSWRWTNNGPTGLPWFVCTNCGASKVGEE